METADLLKKVRKIEIRTRRLSKNIFSGEYHSAFKGKGMAFSEVREYQYGDDIRNIDWNVTARFNHPYVKVFEEERELTLMLLVDISSSGVFGTQSNFKKDLITEICAVLAFSSLQNNDKVGVVLFTDKIEKFIPPKKGRTHILRIIRELINFEPTSKGTGLATALRYAHHVIKKKSIVFILSDFFDKDYEEALKIINKRHDTIAMQIYDEREKDLPDMGLVRVVDSETGSIMWLDTSNKAIREDFESNRKAQFKKLDELLRKNSIDSLRVATHQSYISSLMEFFKMRGSKK